MNPDISLVFVLLATIGAALLGAGLTQLNTVRQKSNEAASSLWTYKVERLAKQLDELYAPLLMLRQQSTGLRSRLPSVEESDRTLRWRLVHHAGAAGTAWRSLEADGTFVAPEGFGLSTDQVKAAHLILETGDAVCELIDLKAGLFDGEPAGGFEKYKDHHQLLRVHWSTGNDQSPDTSIPFQGKVVGVEDPEGITTGDDDRETSIDIAIEEDTERIRTEYETLLRDGPTVAGQASGILTASAGLLLFALSAIPIFLDNETQPDRIMVTTPDAVYCGPLNVGDDGRVSVGGIVVPAASKLELLEEC